MDCKYVVNLISKGGLSAAEQIMLNTHLEGCCSCKEKFLLLDKTFSLLKNEVILPPDDFTDKIMSKIEQKKPITDGYVLPFHSYFRRLIPAAVVATMVVVAGLIFLQKRKPSEVVVTFNIAVSDAQAVTLAGDFNGWDTESLKLKKQNGIWVLKLPLAPGRYQYAFVIDGKNWLADPYAKDYVDSDYAPGAKNSVVDTTRL